MPPICTAVRLPFVRQYAPHLYGSTFGKILGVGVTGTFLNYCAKTSLTNFPEFFPPLFLSHFEPKTSHNARFWGPNTLVFWRHRAPTIWENKKEVSNGPQKVTDPRVFRALFRAPSSHPCPLIFPPSFSFRPCSLSHHFSPLHLPLFPPFFVSRKTPI